MPAASSSARDSTSPGCGRGRTGASIRRQVAAALRPDTALVSLMHANNETGVLTDVAAIAAPLQCARHPAPRRCRAERGQGSGRCRAVRRRAAQLLRAQARRAQGHRRALRAPAAAARAAAAACSAAATKAGCAPARSRCTRSSASAPPATLAGAGLVGRGGAHPRAARALWQALQAAAPLWRNGAGPSPCPGS